MARLRAFAICPTCSELYPSFRGCPVCDRASVPQENMAVAAAPEPRPLQAALATQPLAEAVASGRPFNFLPVIAALSLGVVVACGLLMAALS